MYIVNQRKFVFLGVTYVRQYVCLFVRVFVCVFVCAGDYSYQIFCKRFVL